MLADALQNIDEIRIGIDSVQSACDDQALHDPDVLGTEFGPTEVPMFSSHRNRAQRALQMVGVDRYIRIAQEDFQSKPPLAHVVECLRERIARQQPMPLELASIHSKNASTIGLL